MTKRNVEVSRDTWKSPPTWTQEVRDGFSPEPRAKLKSQGWVSLSWPEREETKDPQRWERLCFTWRTERRMERGWGGHIRLEGWASRAGSKSTGAPESILRTLDHPKGGGTFTGVWNDQMILLSGELCQVIKNSQEEVSVKVGNEIRRWFH